MQSRLERPTTKSKHAIGKSVGLSHQDNHKRRNRPKPPETSTSAKILDVNAMIWMAVGFDSAEIDREGVWIGSSIEGRRVAMHLMTQTKSIDHIQ
jgi:hypothetical protein